MKAFRIGPVLCSPCVVDGHARWIVARETWLRVVTSEGEAIDAARLMATPIEGPFCSDPIAYVDFALHAG